MSEPLDLTHSWTVEEEPDQPGRRWAPSRIAQVALVLVVIVATVTTAALLREDSTDAAAVVKATGATAAAQPTLRSTYELRLTGAGIDVSSKGEMLLDVESKTLAGTIQAPGLGTLNVASAEGLAYVQLPGGRVDASGKHWLSYRSPGGAAGIGAQDPLLMLDLAGDPKKVETIGRETLHDVDTTHYRLPLEAERLRRALVNGGQSISLPEGALDQLSDTTYDVWVDGKNLPRRLELSFAMEQVKAALVFEYLDYGEPVDVDVPDARDVTQISGPGELQDRLNAAQ